MTDQWTMDAWTPFDRGPDGDRSLAAVEAGLQMPLERALLTQRAVRKVLPDDVDDAIVVRCIELALHAPTGSNGQNWEFVVVRDRDTKARIGVQYQRAWSVYRRAGPRLVGAGQDGESMAKILRAVQWQVEHFTDIPVVVVACLRGRPPLVPLPPVGESSFYGSIYPSVQNLLLAARSMGLGASLVTLPIWSTTAIRHILGLPISVQPCCAVPLGWPRGRYGSTTRKPVGDVVHVDRYGNRPWSTAAR